MCALVQSLLIKFKPEALDTLASHEKRNIIRMPTSFPQIHVWEYRKVLRTIMATVEVCGREGIALRSHRPD